MEVLGLKLFGHMLQIFDKNTASHVFSEEFYEIFQENYSVEYMQTIVYKTFFIVSSYPPSLPSWTLPLVSSFAPRQNDFQSPLSSTPIDTSTTAL